MLNTNPDDPAFIEAIKHLKEGDKLQVADGTLLVEYIFDVPSHFPFHQRIFEPGMILKKEDSNVRVYITAGQLGHEVADVPVGHFDDKQIVDGDVLPAERGEGYTESA